MFLLPVKEQYRLLQRIAGILVPGGRLLFTSCAEAAVWNDAMTGRGSRSPGAEAYRRQLREAGLAVIAECEDEGYFDACIGRIINASELQRWTDDNLSKTPQSH